LLKIQNLGQRWEFWGKIAAICQKIATSFVTNDVTAAKPWH